MKKWTALALGLALSMPSAHGSILFTESFQNNRLSERGWYDMNRVLLSTDHYVSAPASLEFRFRRGATVPDTLRLRRQFRETESLYLSYNVKYSDNWVGSRQPQHPHEFLFMTNKSGAFARPAESRLTFYVEQTAGRMQLALQDSLNIDTGRLRQDLTNVTERRAVAGCNGDSDRYAGRCYQWGSIWRNIKDWKAPSVSFRDERGPHYKGNWHHVEAYARMNTIRNGRAVADGVMQLWVNGERILNFHDVVFRTGRDPDMRFNQLMIAPYIGGGGSPIDQTMWVDNVQVGTARPQRAPAAPAAPEDLQAE